MPTRVLLAEIPRMLSDIVRRVLAAEPELEVVGPIHDRAGLSDAVARADAEVVIVGIESREELRAYEDLLYAHSRVTLLALQVDGRQALLYTLRPHTELLGELSPAGLIEAIRAATEARAR